MRLTLPTFRNRNQPDDTELVQASAGVLPPLVADGDRDLEVTHLWRYVGVIGLVAACAMLSAWSRIDLVETSAALGSAETRLAAANADRARLELEYAALTDPARLSRAAEALGLDATVKIVVVPESATEAPR